MPHHITEPGNRRQERFFSEDDYKAYLELMAEWCGKYHLDKQPEEWPWSSASVHIKVKNDILVNVSSVLSIVQDNWKRFCRKQILLIKWKPFANMNEQDGLWAVILLFKIRNKNLIKF
jgi:hypothetical protein